MDNVGVIDFSISMTRRYPTSIRFGGGSRVDCATAGRSIRPDLNRSSPSYRRIQTAPNGFRSIRAPGRTGRPSDKRIASHERVPGLARSARAIRASGTRSRRRTRCWASRRRPTSRRRPRHARQLARGVARGDRDESSPEVVEASRGAAMAAERNHTDEASAASRTSPVSIDGSTASGARPRRAAIRRAAPPR